MSLQYQKQKKKWYTNGYNQALEDVKDRLSKSKIFGEKEMIRHLRKFIAKELKSEAEE